VAEQAQESGFRVQTLEDRCGLAVAGDQVAPDQRQPRRQFAQAVVDKLQVTGIEGLIAQQFRLVDVQHDHALGRVHRSHQRFVVAQSQVAFEPHETGHSAIIGLFTLEDQG
jgi:hypothetical protein